ncbi:YXWGXW repeat-containing protein [Spirosoma foliorum]|uniref:YXWGXW repeat-containing protein n=1 Tax=Spirosoma foliorum TaxID=2710596 RepID=A0A7G5H634_9BACT|nr:YXWGXW repeat-containing protein [Spirosoma foliorum]QMW06576.1 YXWGXW repeat-containing protein [Spirosoma foliorum]
MKTILKSLLFSGLLLCSIVYADAQVYVRRPMPPRTRVVIARPPMQYHRQAWVARPYRPNYRYRAGYWAPRHRAVWVPGYWVHRRRGNVWVNGYWR